MVSLRYVWTDCSSRSCRSRALGPQVVGQQSEGRAYGDHFSVLIGRRAHAAAMKEAASMAALSLGRCFGSGPETGARVSRRVCIGCLSDEHRYRPPRLCRRHSRGLRRECQPRVRSSRPLRGRGRKGLTTLSRPASLPTERTNSLQCAPVSVQPCCSPAGAATGTPPRRRP